jgi:hypothetical protein
VHIITEILDETPLHDAHSPSNESLHCYDPIEELTEKREKLWFWLEGVLLFIVGILGLLGNTIAITILSQSPENTEFNILLI